MLPLFRKKLMSIATTKEMAAKLGVKPNTWERHRIDSKYHPKTTRFGGSYVYNIEDTIAWAKQREYGRFK